jgi:ribosomal protein S18 acetylase RimI-like enzyme
VAVDGAVVGYAIVGRAARRGYVQRLAVAPEVQGSGLGRALLIDGLRWLGRRGAARAVVNTQVDNDRARRLYESLGFRMAPSGLAVLGRVLQVPAPAQ